MDLRYSDREIAFRNEARRWLEANVPRRPLPSGDTPEGFASHVEWEKRLFAARWAVVSWPEAYGGREATPLEWLIFEEEYHRAGAPSRVTQNGIFLLAPTLFEFGTRAQKDRILKKMAAAEEIWAQAWSEPGAGSDLASITSKAIPVEGGFRVHGQKIWCTRGAYADAIFGLFRSDPNSERHHGLTYLLVPLHAEGVTVRPVRRLDGDEGFATVELEDVFVPAENVVGKVGDGWAVAMATTGSERGLTLRSPGRFLATAARLVHLFGAPESGQSNTRPEGQDPLLRDAVVQAWMGAEAYRLYTLQTVTRLAGGEKLGPESSLNKIFWSELDVRMHETALAILGARAELVGGAPDAVDDGAWMKGFQFALAGPIYAGTNEIQRNVVAERLLGLPRR